MLPNWLRIILLILSLGSFLPQLHLIWTRKDASGIALAYVLLNLIATTEQFATNYGFIALLTPSDGVFVHNPITVGDWLNLAQTTLLWVLFTVYFALCLYFPSQATYIHKRRILGIYIAYLFIAIIPLFICSILLRLDNTAWRELPVVNAFTPHTLLLNYIGTILAIVAAYRQARVILRADPLLSSFPPPEAVSQDPHHNALSLVGLAMQTVLFILLAISWVFRVSFPPLPNGASWRDVYILKVWYEWVGSLAVDNAIFGAGQAILLLLEWQRGKSTGIEEGGLGFGPEREPLLPRPV